MSDSSIAAVAPAAPVGRLRGVASWLHAVVGWGAAAMALGHLGAVLLIARGRGAQWLAMQLVIGAVVLVPAWWMVRSAAGLRRGTAAASAILSAAMLWGVSFGQMLGWRATFPAVFALLASTDGIALAWLPRRWGWRVVALIVFVGMGVLAVGAYAAAGGELIEP